MKVLWFVSMDLVGCQKRGTLTFDEDADDVEIDETVRDFVMEKVEWGWERVDEPGAE